MTKVHRYRAVQLISAGGVHIGYDPHGPDVVMASAYDELRAQLAERDAAVECMTTTATSYKSELAERDALLRQQLAEDISLRVAGKIEAALSTSAEPIAPAAPYPNRLCHIDYTAHPYQCGCLKGDEESQRIHDEHFGRATVEPSAPVELATSQGERDR